MVEEEVVAETTGGEAPCSISYIYNLIDRTDACLKGIQILVVSREKKKKVGVDVEQCLLFLFF